MPADKVARQGGRAAGKTTALKKFRATADKKTIERRQIWHYTCRRDGKRRKTYNFEIVSGGVCPTCLKNVVPENQRSLFEPLEVKAGDRVEVGYEVNERDEKGRVTKAKLIETSIVREKKK